MMTREHHRRRSPESSRRRRKERRDSREQLQNQQIALPAPPPEERNELIHLRSRATSPLSSSSSTSSSLVNISRPSRGFGLGAFFGGGGSSSSSKRKQHRVKKKRSRFLRFGNSSSSSVGSDLAYGKGYVERRRSREFSPPSSSAGRPRLSHDKTDEEILELGRKFAEIARQQNAEDLKAAGRSRPSTLVSAATVLSQFRRTNSGNSNRGVGSSKPRLDDSSDDSEWESASEDESSSEFDSGLAYGSSGLSLPNTVNEPPPRQSTPRSSRSSRSPRPSLASVYGPPLRRKSSVVDPKLFGPINSLRGYVDAPCGFDTVDRSTVVGSPRPYEPPRSPSDSVSVTRPLQTVYPVPTSDPNIFGVSPAVSSQQNSSAPLRPEPVPIQHPRPITRVPTRVLDSVETDSEYSERVPSKREPPNREYEDSAIASLTTTVLGSTTLGSDRKDDRNKYEGRRDHDAKRRSKRSDVGAQAEKDEKDEKLKNRDDPLEARIDQNGMNQETRPEYGLEHERNRNWEKLVPEIKRKFEEEGRRRDEYSGNNYDKPEDSRKNERKVGDRDVSSEKQRDKDHVNGPEYPAQEGPIDPFQFQVADDAFQTPLFTTPKRPLTPNVITVDREPNFSPDSEPSERLSRRDSYERELRDALEIYKAAEHATAPVSGTAFAAAAAAEVMAEERRGRSHSRGGDASSRNRSRREESPKREKDVVQEDANRYYREAELARRIKNAETRDAEPSVVGKWGQGQESTIVDVVSPPEMDHPKQKSPYDAPDADVRVDNVLDHPNQLSRFQTPHSRGLAAIPVFTARDPSAERERPMLNIVRPTPIPTPIPEGQQGTEEPRTKLAKKIDIPPPEVVPDVVIETRTEVPPAPSIAKSVSWGENQTKRYVVESPEREDDPYSGTKIVTPAKAPRARTSKRNAWGLGFIAATLGGGSSRSTQSTSERTVEAEASEPRKPARNADDSANRRASAQFKNTHDSPPIPGPKPPPKPSNLKGAQVSGTFAEDPVFTANIAAALEGSGFDPNIVINDANFHKRDSPPRPDDFGGYRAPFVESVTDLGLNDAAGVTSSGGGREHGFVIGEVSTPSDERDIPTDKSQILSELNRAEQHKLDKTSEQDSTERRQVTRDDKLGKGRDLESEFMLAKGQDTSPKKKLKKSKRPIVVQDDFKQSGIAEAPRVVVPADAPRDVHDVYTTQLDNIPNRLKENDKGAEHDWEIYDLPPIPGPKPRTLGNDERKESGKVDVFSTPDDESDSRQNIGRYRFSSGGSFSRTVLPSELSTASSYGIIDTAESTIATEEEWDMPKKKGEKKSKRDDRAYDSPSGSAPISDASPLPENDQRTLRKGKKSKHGSIDDEFAFPAARDPKDQDARAPIEVLYDSPKEMTESISDVSSEKTTPAFDASTHEPQRRDPKQDKRSTPADIPRDENNSIERGPTDKGDDRSEVLDRDINFIAQDQTRYIDNQRNTGSARGENVDDAKSVASTLRSAGKKDRKGSKSETDRKGSGSTSFFGRLKSSIGIADEKQPLRKLEEDKNESFLGSADIHGAGAGLTGDAILPQESLSNANNAPSDEKAQTAPFTPERQSTLRQKAEPIDPDIVPREIRPAIDPKHGDFLPLPPSRPVSPLPKLSGDFPPLPDSRPETPDHERHLRETPTHTRRRSTLETPKTPSQSAIPIQFFRPGHRHTPSNGRSSPSVSPITATVEFGGESKNRSRPASWEGSRDFKPLFLLQRALRGSVDLSGSPERESSPSGSEARERGSPSSTHLFLESPDRDRTSRDNIFSGPMSSPIGISVDKPESSHAAEKVLQLSESPLSQMPNVNEALLHRIRADSVHLSPLPEESDLKPAEEGSPSPFSSPTFLVAANSKDQGGPVEDPPKDNLKESTIPTKGVAPVLHEPEIMITPDDHSPNKVDEEVVPIEAPRDLLPVTDSFAGIKTPDSVDTFDTALSNADDREPLQSSDSLDKTQDNESSIDELLIDSANLGVTPLQDEALSGVGHGQTLPTEQVKAAPIYIPGKDESQIPEQDEDDNMSIETLVPETSIPEAREEQLPIETQESDKAPVQLVEDIVPPESNLKPIRKSTSTEDNSTIVEGPALSREEPTTLEPKTPEIEGDSPTVEPRPVPTPELAPTPSESVVDENFATPEAEIAVQPETSTIELGTPSIKPEHDTVELETTTTGSDMLSAEPSMTPKQATPSGELDTAKIDLGVKETHAEGPKTSDVQKDIPATEAKPAVVESETPIVGLEEIANPEPIIPQNDLAPTGTEAPAAHVESTIVGTELDSKQEPALTIAEPEEPEQFAPTPEAYPSASEEDVKKERDMQLPSSDDKRAESPVSVEEAAQETSVGNPSGLSVGPQAHNQEQLKAASQELHDGRIEIPKETPSIIEASAEEMKSTALEPEVQAVDEQIPARGEEDQLLSKSLSPAVQTEHQQLDTPVEEFMEAPTSPVLTEGQSALPTTGEPSSGHVKQILQEPKVPSEANRGNEETPSEVPTPSQPIELALNSPTIENHDDPQPTISEEQPQSMLEPVSEEIRPPGDSMKPKLSNVDREQYDEQPSLAEASPQRPSEHQTGDSELLENTNVDESSLQRDILDGEDIRDKQGPVSTDAPEAPLSKPDSSESSEDKQDKSAVPPQVVEEASGVEPATDDTQPPSSLNEVVNDEVQEMAQSQDELNSKKGTSKGMRLDTSDVVDTSIATVPSPEPVPQEAPSEADTIESQAATDVLQESSQNLGSELGASVAEEHSTAPQSTVEVVQEPVLEKAEPTTKDVSPEADNSGEESGKEGEGSQPDTVDAPDAAGAPASSVEPGSEKSVVEPTNVETEADSKLPSPSLAPQVDAAAVTQVEHEVPEPESTPSKEDGEDEKLGSTQIETVANNTPQEIPEALDTRVVADKELISPTQPTIERISDDMQVIIAEEETNVSPGTDQLETDEKSENTHTNAEETPASVISPEVSAEPSAIPEDTVRAGEESDPDLAAPSIERPEKDGEEHQSAQLPEQIEKHSTEVPPATVSEAPVTNSDRVSIDVSLPSDTRPEPEDHSHGTSDNIGEATKTEQEPSQDQPVEPLDQLTEPIEATTQSNAPDDIQSGLDSKDIEVSTTAEEPTPEKDTNDSEGIPNGLLVGSLPNDKSDGAQKTPGEVIPAVQGSANDSIPIKADVIQDPSTQDVPQVIPSLPPQDNSPTEASPPVALETQDKSEQPTDGMTDDSVLATSQVDESTEAMPISAEDDQPSPAEHMNLGDMQVGPSLLADNKSQTTIEVLPTIEEEGESEGQETPQETPEPTMGAAVPVDEASIEVLSSGPVEIPPTIPQDQTNPGEVTPEAPTIAKSEESVSQPHQDDPQNPITEDKGKGKEISPVQEQKPESSPLPIETPTEQPQAPIPESNQPQDVMPVDSHPVQEEIKTEPHLTEQDTSGPPDIPTPGTSKTAAGTIESSPSIKEPEAEPRPSDVTGTTLQSQNSEQEPGVQTDKAGDDVLITRPEIAPSGEVINVQDQEKTRQTRNLTENAMLEEEPVAEYVRDDESLESMVTSRPKKIKKRKKRGTQSILDGTASIPSQDPTECISSMPAAADESVNPTKSAMPTISEEFFPLPSDRVDEPIETALMIAQQDIPNSYTDTQPIAADAKEISEAEPTSPKSVSIDKESEENKLTPLDDVLPEQSLEKPAEESLAVLPIYEQGESHTLAPTEASMEESLENLILPKRDTEEEAKRDNIYDENTPEAETSQVSMGTIGNSEQMEIDASNPPQSPRGADIIDFGDVENKEDIEIKDVGHSDDVQSQEQNQAGFESAIRPDISEPPEIENIAIESLKDEKINEVVPTKKSKKSKKKQRASLREDETTLQQEPAQPIGDPIASTATAEQIDTANPFIQEDLADQDATDLMRAQNDEEKGASIQKPESETQMPTELEPDFIPQELRQPESSIEVSSTSVPPTSVQDTVPVEETEPTGLPGAPAESADTDEAPNLNIQDSRPSADNLSIAAPTQVVEEQVHGDSIPESDIPLLDQFPAENITVPIIDKLDTEDTARLDTVSQVPEQQTDILSSLSQEPASQDLEQLGEKHEEVKELIASDTLAGDVQPETSVPKEAIQAQDLLKQESIRPGETIASEELIKQEELPELEELPGIEEPIQQSEPEQPASVSQEPLQTEVSVQEEPAQTNESAQRSEPENFPREEAPTRLERSVTPAPEFPVVLDEIDSTPTKKSRKNKKKKKASQAEPDHISEIVQPIEPPGETVPPEQSVKQPIEPYAGQRTSWGFFGGLTDSFRDLLGIQEPTVASKDNKNAEGSPVTKPRSKMEENGASEPETGPTPKTVPSLESAEQSSMLEQPQESQQPADQPTSDDTPAIVTDAVSEDVSPEVTASKKSKKKKKKASQASQEPESSNTASLETQEQLIPPEEPSIQESQEQPDALSKAEEVKAVKEKAKPREDVTQSSGSKMSKKERRKMKKLAALAAELFQPEPNSNANDEPMARKPVPSPSEQPSEPVNPTSKAQTAPTTSVASIEPQEESLQPILEAESSTQPIQERIGDLAERKDEEIDVPTILEDSPAPISEQAPISFETDNTNKDAPSDSIVNATSEVARDVQEPKENLPDVTIGTREEEQDTRVFSTPNLDTKPSDSDSDPQPWGLPEAEKQNETTTNMELLLSEEQPSEESVKRPRASTPGQQELPTNQRLDAEPSLSKELEPPSPSISRKKAKKDRKKKRLSAQAGLETGSGSQTPVSQGPNISNGSGDITTGDPTAQGPERTTVNEGEWLESPINSLLDKTRRKVSGTSTPLESIEDVLANASPDTIARENAPRRLTLENISEVEGQSSKAEDVEEETPPKSKDQDQNAENINISQPDKSSVELLATTRPPSSVSERHPDRGSLSEARQDTLGHIELPAPVTPPRTPSTVAARTVNVDLSPAQLSSHVEHERPFDQSPQPGKRIKTHLTSDDAIRSGLVPAQSKSPRGIESSYYDSGGLLPPAGSHITDTSGDDVISDITPTQEITAPYPESQLIPTAENSHDIENKRSVKQSSTLGLLPVLTPLPAIEIPFLGGQVSNEARTRDDALENITREPISDAPLTAMAGDISASPVELPPSQLGPEHVEKEKTRTIQPKALQSSPIQDTTTPARKIAAILMESHFHSFKKGQEIYNDAVPTIPENIARTPSIQELAHPPDNRAMLEMSEAKGLEKHTKDNTSELETGSSTEIPERAETPSSSLKEIGPSKALPAQINVTQDIESPVVGREVRRSLMESHDTGYGSPEARDLPTTEIIQKVDGLDTSEHGSELSELAVEREIDEASLKSPSPRHLIQDYGTPGRSSPRVLPPVKEETREELQSEGRNRDHDVKENKLSVITEANRDSGFATGSPNPMRQDSMEELSVRDSGVHLRDWAEDTPKKSERRQDESSSTNQTPQPNEKGSKKLGLGSEIAKLSTPTNRGQDEVHEVQRILDVRKTRMSKSQDVGQRSISDTMSTMSTLSTMSAISRESTPGMEYQARRSASNTSISRLKTPESQTYQSSSFRPESPGGYNFRSGSNTPPLALRRKGKRMSGDLRSLSSNLSNNNNSSRENLHQNHSSQLQQTSIPVANEGRVRAKDMTDVYDGYGEGRIGSPRSPTRPQSMRRRQSIQVLELESRVEQLLAENRALADAKAHVEQNLSHRNAAAIERDAEIESLKASLEWLRKEVTRLTEINEGLNSANNVLALQHNDKYNHLQSQHASTAKELEDSRVARNNYDRALQEKDSEIQELRAQLEVTKEQVREMQRQILAQKPPDVDFLRLKDEDHFDHRCQQLCQHVQQWVLRFSKFSDMRACRLTGEINDEKIIDRLDNAVLDGSDVDVYLSDRVKRRDIFMSMTMNMIWEFVFTRYLFGMDREHRQKLKSLEKLLFEVGPPAAVRQWRAITLTLLSKRPAFGDQRNQDTEAVVQAIFQTLCMILPPPSNLEAQIQSQLRRVMREAVDLSIEMRTQRAEYMMLPPLQPEYDANGDLVRTVAFNAALMNERSGGTVTNEQYESQRAIVRTVLFPLVVKKGDDNGVGDEEVVICPAQVLVAKPPPRATIRMVTPTSDAGTPLSRGATPSAAAPSTVSLQMQDAPLPIPTPPQEAEYLEGGI